MSDSSARAGNAPWTAAAAARAMRLATWDGAVFALMLGISETCFVAEAVRIGAGPLEFSLIASLPLLCGGVGSILVLRGLQVLPQRRVWVAMCALAQVVALAGLALLAFFDGRSVALLLAILCIYHGFGQAAGTAWSSWYGDVVPRAVRGSYFAARTRIVHVVAFGSVVVGGVVLQWLEPAGGAVAAAAGEVRGGRGFAALFLAAAAARLGSACLLLASPEPRFRGLPSRQRPLQWLAAGRGRNAWRLLLGGGLFHAAVYVSAPYFVPYMLEDCRLGYFGYMVTLGAVVAAKAVSLPLWGRLVDRWGSHRTFTLALFLSAWVPLPFFWADEVVGLSLAYAWSGLAWGGYEVAAFALMLDSSTRRTRPQMFAAQGLVNGAGQLGGSLAGAGVVAGSGYALSFTVGFAARLGIAALLPWFVRPMRPSVARRGRGLALRLVGFRPNGGLVHRPVFDESGPPQAATAAPRPRAGEPEDGAG